MSDPVFIGVEDGVHVYRKRENLDGIDIAMQREHMKRQAQDNAAKVLWEYYQQGKIK